MTPATPSSATVDLAGFRKLQPSPLFRVLKTTRSSIWVDDQRVALLTVSIFSERCRQLGLKDILGITILRSQAGRHGNIALSVCAFISLLIGAFTLDPGQVAGMIAATIIAGILLGFLLINTLLGPTCQCYLRTAVQNAPVTAVTRLIPARQWASQLSEAVRVAQAETLTTLEANRPPASPTPEDAAL
jgi:hypothetical protein